MESVNLRHVGVVQMADAVREEIRAAFAGVTLPAGSMSLRETLQADEFEDIAALTILLDERMEWSRLELPPALLGDSAYPSAFMDAPSWRFHLPAFLLVLLDADDAHKRNFAVTCLIHSTDDRLDILSEAQKHALLSFLDFTASAARESLLATSKLSSSLQEDGQYESDAASTRNVEALVAAIRTRVASRAQS
jgi:hypothetical protein